MRRARAFAPPLRGSVPQSRILAPRQGPLPGSVQAALPGVGRLPAVRFAARCVGRDATRRLYNPGVGGRIGDGGSRTRIAPGVPGTGVVSARWATDCPSSPFSVKSVDIYTFLAGVVRYILLPGCLVGAGRLGAHPPLREPRGLAGGRRTRCPDRAEPLERPSLPQQCKAPRPRPGNSGLDAVRAQAPGRTRLAGARTGKGGIAGRVAPGAGLPAHTLNARGMPPRRSYNPRVGGRIGDGGSRTRIAPGMPGTGVV